MEKERDQWSTEAKKLEEQWKKAKEEIGERESKLVKLRQEYSEAKERERKEAERKKREEEERERNRKEQVRKRAEEEKKREEEKRRRQQEARAEEKRKREQEVRAEVFGDSMTRSRKKLEAIILKQAREVDKVRVHSGSGWEVDRIIDEAKKGIKQDPPKALLVQGGTNNILKEKAKGRIDPRTNEVEEKWKYVVGDLKKAADDLQDYIQNLDAEVKVIWMGIPPIPGKGEEINTGVRWVNSKMEEDMERRGWGFGGVEQFYIREHKIDYDMYVHKGSRVDIHLDEEARGGVSGVTQLGINMAGCVRMQMATKKRKIREEGGLQK